MRSFRSSIAAFLVAGLAIATGFFGFNFVQDYQFARAAEKVEATREQLARVDDLASVFRYVGKVVEPSVVNINVTKGLPAGAGGRQRFHQIDPDELRKFFRDRDGDGQPDMPQLPDGNDMPFEQHGTGSGVIMEVADGSAYILTNNHVAGGATQLDVTLHDGRKISNGKVIGTDEKTDLAVIKVQADRLIGARWGNSDELQKGDWIMAFGSPFGYVGSMTHGIVSALNRQAGILGRYGYESFIQVDAPINPGNSGGPLVNVRGEVVGINTAIASRTGAFSGIGFAIPSNQAKFVYESLKKNGKVSRGWLGVSISDVSHDLPKAHSFGYKGTTGVLVEELVPGTPAVGKLEVGDIVTAINGKGVESVQQLRNVIAATAPNTEVKMTLFRDGKEQQIALKLGEQPDTIALAGRGGNRRSANGGEKQAESVDKLGIRVADATAEHMKKFGVTDISGGAVVTSVERNSLAAKAGIASGDVISRIGQQKVTTAQDLTGALAKADLKKGVRLYVTTKEPDTGQVMSRFVFISESSD